MRAHASKSFFCSGILIASLMALVVGPSGGRATVVFDNFDPGGGFHGTNNLVGASCTRFFDDPPIGYRAAAKFTVAGGASS
jgi:hypothetical protein